MCIYGRKTSWSMGALLVGVCDDMSFKCKSVSVYICISHSGLGCWHLVCDGAGIARICYIEAFSVCC